MLTDTMTDKSSDVPAILNYNIPASDGKPLWCSARMSTSEPQTNVRAEPKTVVIHDARARILEFSLEKNGFQFFTSPTKLEPGAFFNDRLVRTLYYPEVVQFLQERIGAKRVIVAGHLLRQSPRNQSSALSPGPAYSVHSDRTLSAAEMHAREIAGGRCDHLFEGRYRIVNVWRPIHGPVYDEPLALMDYSTLNCDRDLMPLTLMYTNYDVHSYVARYSDEHVWYYVKEQTPDEVTVLMSYDSLADGRARICMHSAFHDPTSSPDAEPRQSIEVRCLVFDKE